MENRGILYIPDISGFTNLVTNVELEHSRQIIQSLLEILMDANELGFEISEVEGDAILFYKFGNPPEMDTLYEQVEKMFAAFHKHLSLIDCSRDCNCGACANAHGLSLKIITHYGEFSEYKVRNFNKLIGKDVIVAHQLLKNDIEQHEYWLVTRSLQEQKPVSPYREWMIWDKSLKHTENGDIEFMFTQLSPLRQALVN